MVQSHTCRHHSIKSLATVLCLLAAGACDQGAYGPPVLWQIEVHSPKDTQQTIVDANGFTIVFQGVSRNTHSAFDQQIAGTDTGSQPHQSGSGDDLFTSFYQDGVVTMNFAGHTFTLSEKGQRLNIGGRDYHLDQKKIFIVEGNQVRTAAQIPAPPPAPEPEKKPEAETEAPKKKKTKQIPEFQN